MDKSAREQQAQSQEQQSRIQEEADFSQNSSIDVMKDWGHAIGLTALVGAGVIGIGVAAKRAYQYAEPALNHATQVVNHAQTALHSTDPSKIGVAVVALAGALVLGIFEHKRQLEQA